MLALGVLMSQMMFGYLESTAWLPKQVEKLLSWWWLRGSTPTSLHDPLSTAGFLTFYPYIYPQLWYFSSSVWFCPSLSVFVCRSTCLFPCWLSFFNIRSFVTYVVIHHLISVQQLDCVNRNKTKQQIYNRFHWFRRCLDYSLFAKVVCTCFE